MFGASNQRGRETGSRKGKEVKNTFKVLLTRYTAGWYIICVGRYAREEREPEPMCNKCQETVSRLTAEDRENLASDVAGFLEMFSDEPGDRIGKVGEWTLHTGGEYYDSRTGKMKRIKYGYALNFEAFTIDTDGSEWDFAGGVTLNTWRCFCGRVNAYIGDGGIMDCKCGHIHD
jgi:hypothetical protein